MGDPAHGTARGSGTATRRRPYRPPFRRRPSGRARARTAAGRIRVAALLLPLLLPALGTGCGGGEEHRFEPPDRRARVDSASALFFSAGAFDTLTWSSDSLRLFIGNEIFATHCRKCHGFRGRGDTDYARTHDLDVPSLVREDWRYAGRLDSIRHRIFTGHASGMPTWGLERLGPREIDAAAAYVLELREEMLGREEP